METLLMAVTLVSLALAVGMSVLAFKLLRDDRQRAGARVDALSAFASQNDAPSFDVTYQAVDVPQADEGLFHSAAVERRAPRRRWLALAAVAMCMALGAGTVYGLYSPSTALRAGLSTPLATGPSTGLGASSSIDLATGPAPAPGAPAASATAMGRVPPIELLSLRHKTESGGQFVVTGLVQNPRIGQPTARVVAVVYLFDSDGNYFASGKAPLDFATLSPGEESPFVVRIPNVGKVGRYRVGFRSDAGGVVAHVDRRGQMLEGTTAGGSGN